MSRRVDLIPGSLNSRQNQMKTRRNKPLRPASRRNIRAAGPLCLLAGGLFLLGLGSAGAESEGDEPSSANKEAWVVDLDGAVGPASVDLVIRAIDDATDANAEALVIRMDTPGGLDTAMRDLIKAILAAEAPVITYVAPDGARAASAGVYIAYASHLAAMAPATNIGSATPVEMAPSSPPPVRPSPEDFERSRQPEATEDETAQPENGGSAPKERPNQDAAGDEADPDGAHGDRDAEAKQFPADSSANAMRRKVVNDAVAYLQSLAERRGRNIEWAEKAVREGDNLRASAALEMNVIDLVAPSLPALLREIDGREVTLDGETRTLQTADATLHFVETDWRHELLSVITSPTVAYGLLLIGFYGIVLEFYSPGSLFPGVTGVICILLAAYGLQMLPVNYAGLALIIVGLLLLTVELFTPTYGVLGVGGVLAFVIGSIMLMDTDLPGYQISLPLILGCAIAVAGFTFLVLGSALRARARRAVSGRESMIGAGCVAIADFRGEGQGKVRAFGEIWQARAVTAVNQGDPLRIARVDGLILIVEPDTSASGQLAS